MGFPYSQVSGRWWSDVMGKGELGRDSWTEAETVECLRTVDRSMSLKDEWLDGSIEGGRKGSGVSWTG